MRQHWRFVPDPEEYEYVQAPEYQLELFRETGFLSGDCDDSATLVAAICVAQGWPCEFVAIRQPGDYEFSHVWLRVLREGAFLDIDPIVPAYSIPITGFAESIEVPL